MIPYIHRGNLVQVYWAMKNVTDNDFSLDGLDYRLYYSNGNGRSAATGVAHSGNVVQWSFQPTAEWAYGIYTLVLELYSSGTRLMSITYPNAFHLGKNDVIPAQVSDDSQQGTQTALQEQEEVSIAIRTWGDFYRFQPVVPVVDGEHGYWVVDGEPVVDDDGHYVYAGPTANYDSESEYLIINAGRYNEYTVTAFHEALEAIRTATAAAQDLEATISGNETDRVGAETLRVAAEALRVEAERQRVSREAARIDAEALREYNESQRAVAEEVRAAAAETAALAETARIAAENARALKEGQRNTAEGNRASAEQGREEAEAVRLLAEEDRAEKEMARQEAEEARGTAESRRSAAASLDHQRAQADHETAVGDHEAIGSKADKSVVDALAVTVAGKYTKPSGGIPKTDLANAVQSSLDKADDFNDLIPAQASSNNKLADKNFVNSSIQTNTATFKDNWETWDAVPFDGASAPSTWMPVTNNDYMVVRDASDYAPEWTADTAQGQGTNTYQEGAIVSLFYSGIGFTILFRCIADIDYSVYDTPVSPDMDTEHWVQVESNPEYEGTWRFKYSPAHDDYYKFDWHPEYQVNEKPLTAAQLAALNSEITAEKVGKLDALPTNADLTDALAGKAEKSEMSISSSGDKTTITLKTGTSATVLNSHQSLTPITELIPAQATAQNQLADKNFVNSSIATNTATFRGTFNLVSDLELTISATQVQIAAALLEAVSGGDNNDYVFVQIPTADATPTEISRIDRYKFNGSAWSFEFSLNNSSFTAAQWAAINSGITSALVTKLGNLPTKPVDTASQVLSAAEQLQARTNIGATAPEIFVAEFGVTPFTTVYAAIQAGKQVVCVHNNHIYVAREVTATYIFMAALGFASGLRWISCTSLTESNWQNLGINSIEFESHKKSAWSATPTDTNYPSEKLVYDSLGKKGVISQTQTWSGSGNNPRTYTMSDLVYGDIPRANIDLFVAAGAVFNATTGYFELNGLTDISYREMQQIALNSTYGLKYAINLDYVYRGANARTVYPLITVEGYRTLSARETFNAGGYLEVIKFSPSDSLISLNNPSYCFRECFRLKTIIGIFTVLNEGNTAFYNNRSLENITFVPKVSVSFYASSALSVASILYMINNEAATSAITITLHATAYARAIADADVQTALSTHPLVTLASA